MKIARRWGGDGRGRLKALAAKAFLFLLVSAGAARADQAEHCSSADGVFAIESGRLRIDPNFAAPPPDGGSWPFEVVQHTLFRNTRGFCESAEVPGERFEFSHAIRFVAIRVALGGEDHEVSLICERIEDAMPAGLECDRRIVTSTGSGG